MARNTGGASSAKPVYKDFDPFCSWQNDTGHQTLVVHLPAFRKEQLRVRINYFKTLKISGERPLDATKRSRFYKEIRAPKDCKPNEIHAKFVSGLLYIVMPKRVPSETKTRTSQAHATNQVLPSVATSANAVVNTAPSSSNTPVKDSFCPASSRLERLSKMTICVAVVVAVVAAISACVLYSYFTL